jgi:hypothetical protein
MCTTFSHKTSILVGRDHICSSPCQIPSTYTPTFSRVGVRASWRNNWFHTIKMLNEEKAPMTQEKIHVDVKHTQKKASSRRSRQKLTFFPEIVDTAFFSKIPGLPQDSSNLCNSTRGCTLDAFMAYERYGESCERCHTNQFDDNNLTVDQDPDTLSLSSLDTKDTFSTSPAVETTIGGGGRFIPPSVTRACSWHFKWAEAIVKSRTFKRLSIFLIMLTFIICAVATTDWVTESVRREQRFDTTKEIIVWVMTAELVFQFLAHGPCFFADGWLLFDLIVIGFSWTYNSVLVIRTFRVVRTLRYVMGDA